MSMINNYPQPFNNPVGFLSILPSFAIPVGYEEYKFKELTQEHIEKIYKINNTFLAHREKLLSALFPDATKMNEFTYGDNTFRLCIKKYRGCEVGYWEFRIVSKLSIFDENYQISSDIISLVAVYFNSTFIEAIELIYGHITSNPTLYPHVIKEKAGYKEELFPIARQFDTVKKNNNFILQLEKSGAIFSNYTINNSLTFLYKCCYKNMYNQYVEIFFGYFHRYNSAQNTFIAMDISKFNSLEFKYIADLSEDSNIQKHIREFYNKFNRGIRFLLLDLPQQFRKFPLLQLSPNFPYGIMIKNINYLYQFDFSTLKDHVVFIEINVPYYEDKKILLSSLEKLKEVEKKYHIDFYLFFDFFFPSLHEEYEVQENDFIRLLQYIYHSCLSYEYWTLSDFSSSELYKCIVIVDKEEAEQKEVLQKSLSSGFSSAKNGFANQNRKVEAILSPIINSGQVIWLYAPEKMGKTFMAMSVAYVVSKGNCSVCGWQSKNPKNVLYIDGEMSGAGLKKIYSKIVRGFQNENSEQVLFDSFLFAETDEEYETILDPIWLEEFKTKLYQYDLIILDSYYSLNNNSKSLKDFFSFLNGLKKHNVAVLVIDHTNRVGELQGSIDKRRFADLGIQLEYGKNKNEIIITYEFDRQGIASSLSSQKYYKDFSNNAFKFIEIEDKLTREELIGLLEYILHSVHKIKQKELAQQFTNEKNYNKRISENCKLMERIIEKKEDLDKYHCNLLRSKYHELIDTDKDSCLKQYQKLIDDCNKSERNLSEIEIDSENNNVKETNSTPIDNKEKSDIDIVDNQ